MRCTRRCLVTDQSSNRGDLLIVITHIYIHAVLFFYLDFQLIAYSMQWRSALYPQSWLFFSTHDSPIQFALSAERQNACAHIFSRFLANVHSCVCARSLCCPSLVQTSHTGVLRWDVDQYHQLFVCFLSSSASEHRCRAASLLLAA